MQARPHGSAVRKRDLDGQERTRPNGGQACSDMGNLTGVGVGEGVAAAGASVASSSGELVGSGVRAREAMVKISIPWPILGGQSHGWRMFSTITAVTAKRSGRKIHSMNSGIGIRSDRDGSPVFRGGRCRCENSLCLLVRDATRVARMTLPGRPSYPPPASAPTVPRSAMYLFGEKAGVARPFCTGQAPGTSGSITDFAMRRKGHQLGPVGLESRPGSAGRRLPSPLALPAHHGQGQGPRTGAKDRLEVDAAFRPMAEAPRRPSRQNERERPGEPFPADRSAGWFLTERTTSGRIRWPPSTRR